jgi:hypothetical protein
MEKYPTKNGVTSGVKVPNSEPSPTRQIPVGYATSGGIGMVEFLEPESLSQCLQLFLEINDLLLDPFHSSRSFVRLHPDPLS